MTKVTNAPVVTEGPTPGEIRAQAEPILATIRAARVNVLRAIVAQRDLIRSWEALGGHGDYDPLAAAASDLAELVSELTNIDDANAKRAEAELDELASTEAQVDAKQDDRSGRLRSMGAELRADAADLESMADRWDTFSLAASPRSSRAGAAASCSGCSFYSEPWHDAFLALEVSAAPWLAMFSDRPGNRPDEVADMGTFVSEHNWVNPYLLAEVSQLLQLYRKRGPIV